jgi:hypothetical protein
MPMRCYLCGKRMSWFGSAWSRADDGLVFCRPCKTTWPEERRRIAEEALFGHGRTTELFRISRVITSLPGHATVEAAGDLIFADTALCFLALHVYRTGPKGKASAAGACLAGLLAGPLGAVLPWVQRAGQRRVALRATEEARHETAEEDFDRVLASLPQSVVVPREDLVRIRYSWWTDLRVRWTGAHRDFVLERRRRTYRQYEDAVREYMLPAQHAWPRS